MDLTTDELRDRVADLKRAYLSGVLEVQFSDGKRQRFQNMSDILKAIQTGEDWIAQASGQSSARVAFAQHKRGDGPTGPSRFGCR